MVEVQLNPTYDSKPNTDKDKTQLEEHVKEAENTQAGARKVTEPFLQKRTWWGGIRGKPPEQVKELQEPILFLMKESGYTDIIEGVKSGEFIISTPKGEKSIWLTPDKLTTITYGKDFYRGWIAYENMMTPYPEDPIYSSELQRRIIQKVAINYRDVNEAKTLEARTKMWLWIIGAIVIAAVLLFSTDFGQSLISNIGQPAANAAVAAATQPAGQATVGGLAAQ